MSSTSRREADPREPGRPAGSRLAAPGEGVSLAELRLAGRNHSLPLEALRYDVTPVGLHYLLTHYDIPDADPRTWRLAVDGAVARPLRLGLDDIRARPRRTLRVTFECAGNGRALLDPRPLSQPWLAEAVGTAEWTGTPLAALIREARPDAAAVEAVFTGADHGVERGDEQDYARSLRLDEALAEDVLLAYELNGAPLPPQHGFPLRLVVPGWYGMAQVKWLRRITLTPRPFQGFQQARAYWFRQGPDDPGEPVTRILPRALMIPPGMPDFFTRTRVAEPGVHRITGRAWSGWGPIDRVEFSGDGGATWREAGLGPPEGRHAWRRWEVDWPVPGPGGYELCCRATDTTGRTQPAAQAWNEQGMGNNMIQRIPVEVRAAPR